MLVDCHWKNKGVSGCDFEYALVCRFKLIRNDELHSEQIPFWAEGKYPFPTSELSRVVLEPFGWFREYCSYEDILSSVLM
ncbi:unnamed protein product [Larinioides sclopetarius]|uniref:Uncharacterized protein n=1 Tax=Larinioides sclopetarius TaxID=280406 RepID=A0AAV1ZNA0_9ARAC